MMLRIGLLLSTSFLVDATWSILVMDQVTKQIGVAMATCLNYEFFPDNAQTFLDFGLTAVPCHGAIQAQASIQNATGPANTVGKPLLSNGSSAQDIIAAMTTLEADPEPIIFRALDASVPDLVYEAPDLRQYGVVVGGEVATTDTYTGPELSPLYEIFGCGESEEIGSTSIVPRQYTIAVQGNIVAPGTVAATADAFESATVDDDCNDLPDRLLRALTAGYEATGGDIRCFDNPGTKGGVLSYLKVVEPDGSLSVDISVKLGVSEGRSALDQMKEDLAAWRNLYPCGSLEPSGSCDEDGDETVDIPPSDSANETLSPTDNGPTETSSARVSLVESGLRWSCLLLPLFQSS